MPDLTYRNHLAGETSPYLLQHAHNPVEWYPWGETALRRARAENKPLLLSIGYSACHWCHVMAHESFENAATAALMNRYFINVKVDREERPDLDKIYQTAYQLMARRAGGWPLTLFLRPGDHAPFFGGTYFPPTPRHGLPGFGELLQRVADFYRHQPEQTRENADAVQAQLARLNHVPAGGRVTLDAEPLDQARRQLEDSLDKVQGGFGYAPKFPHLPSLEHLLHHYALSAQPGVADQEALELALFSLEKMALGGIQDQLGGGFCRYSVDDYWMIPHFEKMLYDNGPFLGLYSHAWQLSGKPLFRRAALDTADWCLREMQAGEGGFYSSLDADSEGEEGRFYLWRPETVAALLEPATYTVFARHFGLDRKANFEGAWHLHVYETREQVARQLGLELVQVDAHLELARSRLLRERAGRVRPGRDDKILTAWNALMIKGLAIAGTVFQRQDYLDAATRALDFIRATLWDGSRLRATYKDGKAHLNAYLDDYAFLLDAVLHLLQARWRDGELRFAVDLAEALLTHFEDGERGGFYFTSHDHETLLQRPKHFGDDSTPSGNGVAAHALGRLGHLLGQARYLAAAERTLQAAWPALRQTPYAHCTLLSALEDWLRPPQLIVLRGDPAAVAPWQAACRARYAPQRVCLSIPGDANDLPGSLGQQIPLASGVVAYVCDGLQCHPALTEFTAFQRNLV